MLSPQQIQLLGELVADAAIQSYFDGYDQEITQALSVLACLPAEMLYELCQVIDAWQNNEGPLPELLFAWGQVVTGEVTPDDRIPAALRS